MGTKDQEFQLVHKAADLKNKQNSQISNYVGRGKEMQGEVGAKGKSVRPDT